MFNICVFTHVKHTYIHMYINKQVNVGQTNIFENCSMTLMTPFLALNINMFGFYETFYTYMNKNTAFGHDFIDRYP